MKVLVISRADGGVSLMPLDGEFDALFAAEIDEEYIVGPEIWQWKGQASPEWLPIKGWRIVDSDRLPADRAFRNAWRDDGKAIAHDMAHAREIWRDKMRRARRPLLVALDEQVQRSLEQPGTDLRAIAVAKQTLRDVTADPAIEAAQTPEELRAVWPAALGKL